MKIIIKDGENIKKCLIQVRDVNYLAERYELTTLRKALLGKNEDSKKEYEFIEVHNKDLARAIEQNPFIVNFTEMARYDDFTLSRLIFLTQTPVNDGKQRLDDQHKIEDLQDIITFNTGRLPYQIPVLFDDRITLINEDVTFGSTTIPNYYMLRANKKDLNLAEYLRTKVDSLFGILELDREMDSYSTVELEDSLLVKFKLKRKRLTKKRITA
jgi:hypothetical protein